MADELISREALFKAFERAAWYNNADRDEIAEEILLQIPTVNAVVLPCKVGDAVYEIHNNTDACDDCRHYFCGFGDAWCDKIDDIDLRSYPHIAEKPLCEKQFMEIAEHTPNIDWIFHHRAEFGKTVFLTRKEAEKALGEYNPCDHCMSGSYRGCDGCSYGERRENNG